MTNGEKFKEVFQISQTAKGILYEFAWLSNNDVAQFPVEWWNAEFKEPTTKNNLGVDCISREQAKSAIRDKFKDLPSRVEINTILNELPSVTPQNQVYPLCEDCHTKMDEVRRAYDNAMKQEPKWIPVSEKLPEPFTFVNATCRSLVDDRENWVVETVYLPIPKKVNKHGYSDWGNIPMLNLGEAEVIAWVERVIPQPYKADRSE